MTPQDMAQRCALAINECAMHGTPAEDARIIVVLPKGYRAPPKFPRGKTAQWKHDGSRVVYMPALKVLAWLAANGAVDVKASVAKRLQPDPSARS